MKKYDLIIIGGGAGAFAAAIKANELGAKAVMINDGLPLGGTCVNVGCVPSKKLLWAGEIVHLVKNHNISGIDIEVKNIDFSKVVEEELALVDKMREEKYQKVLENMENVEFVQGKAKFISKNEVKVGEEVLSADKFIIAVGSTANVPHIEGIKEAGYLTHIEVLRIKKLPRSIVIVGAGPVGLEFSQMFSRFGSQVTVLQRGPSIFPHTEPEISRQLYNILSEEGISIKTNVQVKRVEKSGNEKKIFFDAEGREEYIEAEEIMLAAGKTPNTSFLSLDKAGVDIDSKQAIVVNEYLQTSNENIYAVGDVINMPLRLETTAGYEGTIASENVLTDSRRTVDYNSVPYTIFTDPQIAGVGLTEEMQMKDMGTCACRTVMFKSVSKAIIMGRTEGLIKMIVHPKTQQILGVHILSPFAGDIIAQAMILIKNKNTIDDILNSLPVFPTLSEAIKIAALSFKKDITKLSCCI